MHNKNNYYNIIDAISDLQARGFFLDFNLIGNKLLCAQEKCYLGAEEFEVLEIYSLYGRPYLATRPSFTPSSHSSLSH